VPSVSCVVLHKCTLLTMRGFHGCPFDKAQERACYSDITGKTTERVSTLRTYDRFQQ
jgi:hypothetical protein